MHLPTLLSSEFLDFTNNKGMDAETSNLYIAFVDMPLEFPVIIHNDVVVNFLQPFQES